MFSNETVIFLVLRVFKCYSPQNYYIHLTDLIKKIKNVKISTRAIFNFT